MPIRVLVVDDSSFFRRQISKIIEGDPDIEVVDMAVDGQDAIEKARTLKPDVITMDVEMPVLDGISAVRAIMQDAPTAILMFSSLTQDGAKATLDALEAGAVDFLPKRFEDIARDKEQVARVLRERIKAVARPGASASIARVIAKPKIDKKPAPAQSSKASGASASNSGRFQILAIGTSTGGPIALQTVLTDLPADFPLPIVLVQHMPGSFTPAFAERLDQLCSIHVKQAEDGEALKPGVAYLAPGGMQMRIVGRGQIEISEGDSSLTYKPSVDITFDSLADEYNKNVLALVLTGMGHDGSEGARNLKLKGSEVWAQDEASSVVYGMPAAVNDAGTSSKVLALDAFGREILKAI